MPGNCRNHSTETSFQVSLSHRLRNPSRFREAGPPGFSSCEAFGARRPLWISADDEALQSGRTSVDSGTVSVGSAHLRRFEQRKLDTERIGDDGEFSKTRDGDLEHQHLAAEPEQAI